MDGSSGLTLQGLSSRLWNLWRTDVRAGVRADGLSTGGGRRSAHRGTAGGRAGVVHEVVPSSCTGWCRAVHSASGDVHRCPQVVHRPVGCRPATVTCRQLSLGGADVALCPQSCPHAGDEFGHLTCDVYSSWFVEHVEIWTVGQISGVSESLCHRGRPALGLWGLWTNPGDSRRPWPGTDTSSDFPDSSDRCRRPTVTHIACGQLLWTDAHGPWTGGDATSTTRPSGPARPRAVQAQPREVCLIRLVSSVTWL